MDPPQINYVDPKSLLVINTQGIMRQLFVPIRAQVLYDTHVLKKDSWIIIEEIQPHKSYKLIYRIGNNWWQYDLFKLAATF
jgi:hypothetical protein